MPPCRRGARKAFCQFPHSLAIPGVWSNQRTPWSRPGGHYGGRPPQIHQNTYLPIDPLDASSSFETNVSRWSTHPQPSSRLALYGVPLQDIPALLNAFTSAVEAKELSSPELEEYYTLSRLAHVQSHDSHREYSTWVSHPSSTPQLSNIPHKTMDHIIQLALAADRSFLHEEYSAARKRHRKVIMLVGPTNSGKTHHALRALAASKRGVYAGSLRLVAHEACNFKLRPNRSLGDRRAPNYSYNQSNSNRQHRLTSLHQTNTLCPGMQHDNGRKTTNNLRRRPAPLLHSRNARLQHLLPNCRHRRNPNDRGPTARERLDERSTRPPRRRAPFVWRRNPRTRRSGFIERCM